MAVMTDQRFFLASWDEETYWGDVKDFPTEADFRSEVGNSRGLKFSMERGTVSKVVLVGCRRNSEIDGACQAERGGGFHWHPEPWPSRLARRECWQWVPTENSQTPTLGGQS